MWSVEAMKARSVAQLLVGGLDEVWARQRARMDGLTQEEYDWQPVPDCWAVTERDGGWHVPEPARPEPVPAPVSTIGWRLWHIASDCLADYTVRGLGPRPFAATGTEWYGDVREALAALDLAWAAFRVGIAALGDDGMWTPLGEQWGPFAPEPWAALAVHAHDEVAHHGAEIGLLRDLYLHRQTSQTS